MWCGGSERLTRTSGFAAWASPGDGTPWWPRERTGKDRWGTPGTPRWCAAEENCAICEVPTRLSARGVHSLIGQGYSAACPVPADAARSYGSSTPGRCWSPPSGPWAGNGHGLADGAGVAVGDAPGVALGNAVGDGVAAGTAGVSSGAIVAAGVGEAEAAGVAEGTGFAF